ncbi:hypothetical protein BJ741DRAFT_617970 [Chytriomyces cf. hyalinus JEL632]|nr:hypothetical protein BJ741DRAFT_617970 [Chytriomyces cf. hyalinus JEL632]
MNSEAAIRAAQNQWKHRGAQRPAFALPTQPGQESVWDYPRPPALLSDTRTVQVRAKGNTAPIANSVRALRVLETAAPPTWYIPKQDIDMKRLVELKGQSSFCEWKGAATYWAISNASAQPVAWSYEKPRSEFAALQGHICFYPSRVECYVNDERVRPQPSEFYGGWVTDEVIGPFKGDPGTSHW